MTKKSWAEAKIKWTRRDCEVRHSNGDMLFEMKAVEAPEAWSPLAVEIAASKYFYRGPGKRPQETSIRSMVRRVVGFIMAAGREQGHFKNAQAAEDFGEKLKWILFTQRGFFNSPVWFNCGLHKTYGAKSGSTNWAWDRRQRKVLLQKDALMRPQVSACFIQSIDDSLESIFELAKNEAKLFKFGSGSGTNFSNLRGRQESLERGGKSSGLLAFLKVLDRGAGAIKSGGTTRRAAKMVCLDVDHPEILEFIQWKSKEEKKAQALIAAGYSADFEGEAYQTISGQNANNSVRVNGAFLKAVAMKKNWALRGRESGKVLSQVSAQKLWQDLAQAAWECADPGLQFVDAIQKWHTCKNSGDIRGSNPCSEYLFLDDSACNLASLNLLAFRSKNGFDLDDFLQTSRLLFQAQEILIDAAGYPTEKIAKNSHDFRPLGLGLSGLGAFLMSEGLAYDSEEARGWAASLAALLTGSAYHQSALMAKSLGSFPGFQKNKKSMLQVLKSHQKALGKVKGPEALMGAAKKEWKTALALGLKYGFRNAQATVMAPTGTIGLVLDADTTGIEPEFSLVKYKKLAGGSERRIVSSSLLRGLETLGYSKFDQQSILAHVEVAGNLEKCEILKKEHLRVFAGAMEISPEGHLHMMAAMQAFVSGAISKTVNLPNHATVEQVAGLHWRAYELGLKSIAIYRDGCKSSQPLNRPQDRPLILRDELLPKCSECGAPTELAGGCFRCVNCGTVIGCA